MSWTPVPGALKWNSFSSDAVRWDDLPPDARWDFVKSMTKAREALNMPHGDPLNGYDIGPADLSFVLRGIECKVSERNQLAASLLGRGYTARAIAEQCGVTHQTILNWAKAAR